ncbi:MULTISPECIES: methyltransferase [Streptomyces]|uniref:methyltransferase n=1 Tax=Streptomyces TaxID=1883 RepID=UPI00340A6C50
MTRPYQPAAAAAPDEDLFGSETADYARYRPGLPDAAVRLLAATQHGVPAPVREAHTFTPTAPGRAPTLITCCRSFHCMSRAEVLDMADRVAAPNAVVAIMGDGSLWTHETDWIAALRELIQTYLGNDRRAGTRGTYAGRGRFYDEDLADSAFSDGAEHRFPVARAWRPEDVLGYLRTTSFAGPALFADRHHQFEAEALRLLQGHARGGVLKEDADFTVLLARRPGGDA